MSLQSISVALDTYLLLAPPHRPFNASSYTRPILPWLSSPVSFHRYRETAEIFRLPSERRDSTGGTLICPPRIKATACEILSLALETRLFELAKLDATRETLISQPGGCGTRERRSRAHYDHGQTQSAKYAYKRICSRRKTHLPGEIGS